MTVTIMIITLVVQGETITIIMVINDYVRMRLMSHDDGDHVWMMMSMYDIYMILTMIEIIFCGLIGAPRQYF